MDTSPQRLFTEARSQNGFLDRPVPDSTLAELYDLLKWGPTSVNSSPARFKFVRTAKARETLASCVGSGNVSKVMQAPVTAIIGMDMDFGRWLPKLFPHVDARAMFAGKPALVEATAFRNSSLQGAYLIMAARMLGLDCGPMSGFDAQKVDEAFWADGSVRTNFLCTLGYGDPSKLFPRHPRLDFADACELA